MHRKKIIFFILILLTTIILDQASKTFFIAYLKTQPGFTINISPIFNIIYAWNYGISFGAFSNYAEYSNIAFFIINNIILIYLCYYAFLQNNFISFISICFIIGGAIGNLIDRVLRGAVFDFLFFYYQNYSFPAFNLADFFITIGALIYVYQYMRIEQNIIKKTCE